MLSIYSCLVEKQVAADDVGRGHTWSCTAPEVLSGQLVSRRRHKRQSIMTYLRRSFWFNRPSIVYQAILGRGG